MRYANTSSEIWKDLEERFEKEGAPRAYELKQLLNTTRQGGMSISNYYTKLRSIWDELPVVLPTPRCKCSGCNYSIGKQLNEVKEKERTYEFLMGLDDEFTVVRTQILATKPAPSLSATYHLVAEKRTTKGDHRRIEKARFRSRCFSGALQRIKKCSDNLKLNKIIPCRINRTPRPQELIMKKKVQFLPQGRTCKGGML